MPRNDENTEQLNIAIPRGARKDITGLAEKDELTLSEYVRALIEKDAKSKGLVINLKLQHGGLRKQSA